MDRKVLSFSPLLTFVLLGGLLSEVESTDQQTSRGRYSSHRLPKKLRDKRERLKTITKASKRRNRGH